MLAIQPNKTKILITLLETNGSTIASKNKCDNGFASSTSKMIDL